jgi:hypothetical protein
VSELPDLPAGDDPPAPAAVAERLASLLPAGDRDEAHELLMTRILPSAAAAFEGLPRPRRAVELIYGDLGEQLLAAEPEDRLAALEAAADEGDIRSLAAHAQALAVARYLSEHPDAAGQAAAFLNADAEQWRARGADAIAQEAWTTADALEAWSERVREERPDLFETRRTDYLQARMALGSARTGAFGTVAGPLSDFLARVGAEADRLDVH